MVYSNPKLNRRNDLMDAIHFFFFFWRGKVEDPTSTFVKNTIYSNINIVKHSVNVFKFFFDA